MSGKFVVFEGSDGSGKTTILNNVKKYLDESNIEYILTREPGGTKIGEKIRDILLNNKNKEMDYRTEALLFAAARAQSVEEVLRPALNQGKLVISDRYVLSSIAYQGYARELSIDGVKGINDFAIDGLKPDWTIFFDVDPIKVLDRKKAATKADRLEEEGNNYHSKVYEGYKKMIEEYQNVIVIDASRSIEEVTNETIIALNKIIGE
ncbi:MAG: dTMP kinase [Tissierellia bacterium]|nr:dTMP kinase [Tissierellia bacterium]